MRITRIDFQELINKRAIVNDCLTHFFRAGFSPLPSQREGPSGAVVLNDHRMVDGQVGRTAIEVFKGVATRSHHLGDELVGFAHGAVRVVNEARLDATPLAGKGVGLILRELVQVETADAFHPLPQKSVSTCRSDSLSGSFVLGSKLLAQVHAASPARVSPGRQHEHQDNNANPDE